MNPCMYLQVNILNIDMELHSTEITPVQIETLRRKILGESKFLCHFCRC